MSVPIEKLMRGLAWSDFRLALIGSAVLLLLIALAEPLAFLQPVRFVLGLVYVLFAPGYCLVAAVFPRPDDIYGFERLALSIGLSVAWMTVLALILNWLPWGVRLWPITLGELASILFFVTVAAWRRGRLPADQVFTPDISWRSGAWWRSLPRFERRLLGVAGVALLVAGLVAGRMLLFPSPAEFTTEFYMLGSEGLAESYPRATAVGQEIGVTLGIMNQERGARSYRVEVWAVDGLAGKSAVLAEGRRELVLKDGPYALELGSGLEWAVTWRMPWVGDDQVVELLLFAGEDAEPYRSLRLWLDVTE